MSANDQTLLRLGSAASDAIAGTLRMLGGDAVEPGAVSVIHAGENPYSEVGLPAIAAEAGYADGVNGGSALLMPLEAARRLAAAVLGMDPAAVDDGGELSDDELSTVSDALGQALRAAAAATTTVLGEGVDTAPAEVRRVQGPDDLTTWRDSDGQATSIRFTYCGVPCLLVQLVPHAFIVRMTRAVDELTERHDDAPLADSLRGVSVRVWAELGRARMPSGRVVTLPGGAVVELDAEVDAPIDLYADGMRVATGKLLVTEDGGLAVRIDEVLGAGPVPALP